MEKEEIIEKTIEFVRNELGEEGSGHDYWHVYRVWKNSLKIGKEEEVDMFVVQLAALLHDIADWKNYDGDESVGVNRAREFLSGLGVDEIVIGKVCEIIETVSFKGVGNEKEMKTKEGKIVRDADRLDALGAVGIARGFVFAGNKNLKLHDPEIKHIEGISEEEYKDLKRKSYTQVNHFYEKLLHLKDLMLTKKGREVAEERHKFMRDYLDRFLREWEGEL